ncbi:unnamed protein product [Bursaphelenchus okinawaensis]|uniref:Piwi domain-containing protein n=1 Tax=Bursaphelenchus okinawaensis TaxID=465554 RepID=A0A811JVT6_9BILA|nr:unnamed protein product [Bursaphelenchus okinawaensis]CAG9085254.1 unnamed protein product [Bursaphelenchus okinawaensis]
MRGVEVSTTYAPRHYKILGLVDQYPSTTFIETTRGRMSILDYMRERYEIILEYPNLPMLKMNKKSECLIPLECLRIYMKYKGYRDRLNAHITDIVKRITQLPQQMFTTTRKLVEISGLKETAPEIVIKIVPVYLSDKWEAHQKTVERFLKQLQDQFNVWFSSDGGRYEVVTTVEQPNTEHLERKLIKIANSAKEEDNVVLLMNFLPEQERGCRNRRIMRSDLYDAVKTICDVNGIPNQCINMLVLVNQGGAKAYADNIVRKINTKMNGKTNMLTREGNQPSPANLLMDYYAAQNTMFIGIFSSKSPRADRCPSVHAMAYNVDPYAASYMSTYRYQDGFDDNIHDIKAMFDECLEGFCEEVGPPLKILILRGGISDSVQLEVFEREEALIQQSIGKFRNDFKDKLSNWWPQVCYLNVSRTNLRFCTEKTELEGFDNLKPGTVVREHVTESPNDWYMTSHIGRLGTSKPALYRLRSSTWTDADGTATLERDVEQLCHNLCFLLGRSVFSVAVPTPIYNAQLVVDRCRAYKRHNISGDYKQADLPSDTTYRQYYG